MASYEWPPTGGGGVPIYVNLAAFPAGTETGDLAVAADTGDLYEWNGSAWVLLASPGGASPAPGVNGDLLYNSSGVVAADSGSTTNGAGHLSAVILALSVATGTAPFMIASTTLVPNLYVARSALADTVTTNANLTGPITSVGNATSIAAQTGTGTTFVVQTSPTLITPNIGAATGTSLSVSGQLTSTVVTGTPPLVVSSTTLVPNLNVATSGTATNATNGSTIAVSNNALYFPALFASSTNSNQPFNLSASGLTFNPSTKQLNINSANTNGALNVICVGDTINQGIVLSNANNTRGLDIHVSNAGAINLYDQVENQFILSADTGGNYVGTGAGSPAHLFEVISTDTSTSVTGTSALGLSVTNRSATVNNLSRLQFTNAQGDVDSAIIGIHQTMNGVGTGTGQLNFLTMNAGVNAIAATLDKSGNFTAIGTIAGTNITTAGNVTGTSINVTGTSNATLVTLSALTTASSLVSVGTITTGVWNGTIIDVAHGGTGLATLTANNVILGNGASSPTFVAPGASGNLLQSNGTTWTSAANTALTNPMTTLGDTLYENATPAPARLPGNTTATLNVLTQTGTGSVSAAPAWSTLLAAFGTQTAGKFLAGPTSGSAAAPTFRVLQAPTMSQATATGTATGTGGFVSGTYTVPAGVLYLRLRMVGGGGGGSGSGTASASSNGGAGGNTIFGTNTAGGGAGGLFQTIAVAVGGSPTFSFGTGIAVKGADASGSGFQGISTIDYSGGSGGSTPFGGAGASAFASNGSAGVNNTGSGGGGGGDNNIANSYSGAGGASGAFFDVIITAPSAIYSYSNGAGGTAGAAGTSGQAGAAGGSGYIEVTEYYQ